jgi:polysaccharide pyruvyl transferase WcaK-like protein
MIIELRGVEFHNKGAELMLLAILEMVRSRFPAAVFVMEVGKLSPLSKQRKVGIYAKLEYHRFISRRMSLSDFGFLLPRFFISKAGVITEKEVEVILDGSGFAYGDYWGYRKAQMRLSNSIGRWKKAGKKVVLLPQAFGKFEEPKLQEEMRRIISNADLIFARDKSSHSYLSQVLESKNTFLRPDFTNLITGTLPASFNPQIAEIAIISNNKLVESGVFASKEAYVEFLNNVVEIVIEKGKKPFFLIHEGYKDLDLAVQVNAVFSKNIPVLVEDDPLAVKGIIGASQGVITSRFHGLVSALTQCIPCLCVGWSHKYLELMGDYEFSEGLLADTDLERGSLEKKIAMIVDEDSVEEIKGKLKVNSGIQKEHTSKMWEQVFELIGK